MNKVATGLVLLAVSLWGAVSWWWFLWDVIKGLMVVVLFLAGLALIGLGLRHMGQPQPAKNGVQ
ncbi:MAG: hypothetical protein LHV69_06320 [Elusimicrobia bacterium]|nr:hypothetical protein [Candidatus Obscuribacterium magneticum]